MKLYQVSTGRTFSNFSSIFTCQGFLRAQPPNTNVFWPYDSYEWEQSDAEL